MLMTETPKKFTIQYESGSYGEHTAYQHLCWPALQAVLQRMAERANETVTLTNDYTLESTTVSPYGIWI